MPIQNRLSLIWIKCLSKKFLARAKAYCRGLYHLLHILAWRHKLVCFKHRTFNLLESWCISFMKPRQKTEVSYSRWRSQPRRWLELGFNCTRLGYRSWAACNALNASVFFLVVKVRNSRLELCSVTMQFFWGGPLNVESLRKFCIWLRWFNEMTYVYGHEFWVALPDLIFVRCDIIECIQIFTALIWKINGVPGTVAPFMKLKDVIRVACFISSLQVVVRRGVGSSIVDDEFEFLANFDF